MVFSSLTFLLLFLPAFFLIYVLLPGRYRNLFLLIASLVFYGFSGWQYLFLILGESLAGYLAGLAMNKYPARKKWILMGAILIYAGLFIWFKYTDFILTTLDLKPLKILLPLGISFYTFQIISYNVDIYRDQVKVQKSFINFAMYICMFPQLIAGPIVRYETIEPDLSWKHRVLNSAGMQEGLARFVCGLGKKVLLANQLYAFCEDFRTIDSSQNSVLLCWANMLCLMLYTYFDFSGYSDMAIGLGKMLGFSFPENFNYPFMADSIRGFWRRWHMSLTAWIRDYIYIPLGGNRCRPARHIFNLLVVWLFTGLWHGADWSFVVWGLLFFVLILFETFVLKTRKPGHIVVLLILMLSFLLFNDASLKLFISDVKNLFGFGNLSFSNAYSLYMIRNNLVLIAIAIFGATNYPYRLWKKIENRYFIQYVSMIFITLLCLAYLESSSFNPFLYFRF